MATMVNIESAMAKWVQEIGFHREKVKELEIKIDVAKELMNFPADTRTEVLHSTAQTAREEKPSLRSRVITTLAEKQKWLTATELAGIIQKEGLETESKQVNILVATTANKLVDLGKIIRKKPRKRVLYATPSLITSESGGVNMFDGQK